MSRKDLLSNLSLNEESPLTGDGELTHEESEALLKEQADFYRATQRYDGVELTFSQLQEQVAAVTNTEVSQEVAEIAQLLSEIEQIQSELNTEKKISYALAVSVLTTLLSVLASTRSELAFAESLIVVLFVISTIATVGITYHKFHRESSYEDDRTGVIRPSVQLEHLERKVTGKLKLVLDTYDESKLPEMIAELLHRHHTRT